MLPGIRPAVLGTLSIELVVDVCAVRVEMACGLTAPLPRRNPAFQNPTANQLLTQIHNE